MSTIIRLSDNEREVLDFLAPHHNSDASCFPFAAIAEETGLPIPEVRRGARGLRRKGYAECVRGLWRDDGRPGGSGYRATRAGFHLWASLAEGLNSAADRARERRQARSAKP